MARTKCTARKTTGGKLSSKLKAKNKDAKRNKSSQSDSSSSSEDESSNTSNFPPKQKKIRQSTSSQQQRFNPNANIRMPEDVDDEMLKNIVDRVSFKKYDSGPTGTTCHQCRQKTTDTKTICRSGHCSGIRGMFCGVCLKNRYGMDIRIALKDPNWSCPPCQKICNCSICRNRTGKGATGPLALRAQEQGFMSVKHYLDNLNDVKDEHMDDPLDVKDDPLVVNDEPLDVSDDPLDIKDEPLDVKDEPLDVKDEPPLYINDEHLYVKDEPLDFNDEPIMDQDELLNVKDEPLESNDDFHENIIEPAKILSNDDKNDVVTSKARKTEVVTIFPDFSFFKVL